MMKDERRKPKRKLKVLPVFCLLFSALAFSLAAQAQALGGSSSSSGSSPLASELLETGSAKKTRAVPLTAPATIKIVSYNIRWRGGDDLRRLIELLRNDREIGQAAIIGLQEVDRNRKRTGNINTVRLMAEELGLHYAWAAPPPAPGKEQQEEETGVALLSPYPLTDVTRLVLPNEGPGGRRRVALGASVRIGPGILVRAYTMHAETRTTNEKRLQQFQAVLDDLARKQARTERVVILGDFNTLTGDDVRATQQLFTAARFETPFPNSEPTWKTFIIKLKLDWVWLRGLHPLDFGIDRKVGLSDHWPLWVNVRLEDGDEQPKAVTTPKR
jgi:endonuclease/exonuclease/phosphatase family metal-dependent hydrolase